MANLTETKRGQQVGRRQVRNRALPETASLELPTASIIARIKRLDTLKLEADRLLDRFVEMNNVPTEVSDKAYIEYLKAARRYNRVERKP